MNIDHKFTESLQSWMNTPDDQKDWAEGALMLLQLSGNRIMYHNISINPRGKAEFIKGQLQKYLNFRLQQLTHDEVDRMQSEVDEIVKNVINPDALTASQESPISPILPISPTSETSPNNQTPKNTPAKSDEFAEFRAGKRTDHDSLPEDVQALYVENLDIVHRMRELHMKLRSLSLDGATCPDSERYLFLKEIIALDKKRVQNWDIYDHFVPGTSVSNEDPSKEKVDSIENENPDSIDKANEIEVPEASKKEKPKKSPAKRTSKKSLQK